MNTTMNSTMNTNSNNSFRSWKKDTTSSSDAPQSNNAFARMSRDRQDKYRSAGPSYAGFKRKQEEEAKEREKNRPLTEADFPALGVNPAPAKVKVATTATTSSLAAHIADTIRKDEETLSRRKREEEEAREKAAAEEGIVRLPLFKNMKDYVEWKNKGGLQLPPMDLPPQPVTLRTSYKNTIVDDDEYDDEEAW